MFLGIIWNALEGPLREKNLSSNNRALKTALFKFFKLCSLRTIFDFPHGTIEMRWFLSRFVGVEFSLKLTHSSALTRTFEGNKDGTLAPWILVQPTWIRWSTWTKYVWLEVGKNSMLQVLSLHCYSVTDGLWAVYQWLHFINVSTNFHLRSVIYNEARMFSISSHQTNSSPNRDNHRSPRLQYRYHGCNVHFCHWRSQNQLNYGISITDRTTMGTSKPVKWYRKSGQRSMQAAGHWCLPAT